MTQLFAPWCKLMFCHMQGKRNTNVPKVEVVSEADLVKPAAEGARTILTLGTAMGLYGLTESESFWELKQDTRCLVSWGHRHVVVAFRGTASMRNALADLQVRLLALRTLRCLGFVSCSSPGLPLRVEAPITTPNVV